MPRTSCVPPLSKLILSLEMLEKNFKKENKNARQIQESIGHAKKASGLLASLLEMAVVSKSQFIPKKPLRLDELTMKVLESISEKYPQTKISFNVSEEVPSDNHFEVVCNEELINLASYNLLENACKYSESKPIQVTLDQNPAGVCTIHIIDQGVGIDSHDSSLITEPLYRGKNVGQSQGYGIGLSLVKRILELHQSQLVIESTLGQGTHMSFSIYRD